MPKFRYKDARGRKTKLTDERLKLLEELVNQGVPVHQIAERIGVSHTSIYQWWRKGSEGLTPEYKKVFEMFENYADKTEAKIG